MSSSSLNQERLNLIFEMESIKMPLMQYIAPGVSLKVITELGSKDQNGRKRKFYEEFRYESNKYKNTDHLISANIRFNSYLVLEYPNSNYKPSYNMKSNAICIKAYALDDVIARMKEFNESYVKCFGRKKDSYFLKSDKVKEMIVYPTASSQISFKADLYRSPFKDYEEPGVRLTFNESYSCIISGEDTWPEMLYKIAHCDLTMLGLQMIQSYMALLPATAISDLGKDSYDPSSKYTLYWDRTDNNKSFFDKERK